MGKGIIVLKDGHKGALRNNNGNEIPYFQSSSDELGIEVGRKVVFDVYIDPTSKVKTAFNVELVRKGKIIVVKDGHKGTIQDDNFGEIEAEIPFGKERGFEAGQEVRYRLVTNGRVYSAVYVDLIPER
jgi:hypothetical protein